MRVFAPFLLTTLLAAADLKSGLTFRATFDQGPDATIGEGDRRIHQAPDYKRLNEAKPGLDGTAAEWVKGEGVKGGALRFKTKNTGAIFFRAARNVNFAPSGWTGTVSFWLRLTPDEDLAPGYCDPLQVTDKDYNDSAIWVDFTKDEKPRHFRLGVFGALKAWNPQNLDPDKNPAFNGRLVVVKQPPFRRDKWTHVAVVHEGLGGGKGSATLYVDGVRQGASPAIAEAFAWDMEKATIRLGVNYTGLMDDVAIFSRALSGAEVARIAKGGL